MLNLTQILAFLVPTLALNLTPGPDMLFVVSQGSKGGTKAALRASLGLWLGYLLHIALVALGLAALLAKYPQAFVLMKFLGGSYLFFIGIKLLFFKTKTNNKTEVPKDPMWDGIFVSALNPKVAIFFLAFLPQFITADSPSPTIELALLGLLFSLSSSVVNFSAGLLAIHISTKRRARKFSMETACGFVMIGMAARLAWSR